jgi:hypothetical protein
MDLISWILLFVLVKMIFNGTVRVIEARRGNTHGSRMC